MNRTKATLMDIIHINILIELKFTASAAEVRYVFVDISKALTLNG